MFPLKPRYHVLDVWSAFNDDGSIKPEHTRGNASTVLAELAKIASATKSLRS
jgi:hypothetical protein